jgi:hypothetical protein
VPSTVIASDVRGPLPLLALLGRGIFNPGHRACRSEQGSPDTPPFALLASAARDDAKARRQQDTEVLTDH